MKNKVEDHATLETAVDAAGLHRQVRELEAALANPAIYSLLLSSAKTMNRKTFGRNIQNGWDEALFNARQSIVNLGLICAELANVPRIPKN